MTADEIISLIKERYNSCPNIEDGVCYTWWKHEECEAYRGLLFAITNEDQYKEPMSKMRTEVREEFDKMMSAPDTLELINRLKSIKDKDI